MITLRLYKEGMKTKSKKNKVNIVTLGCSKNLVDSEVLMGQLKGNDIEAMHESTDEDANIVVVNTCGFIENAKEESINTILQMVEAKQAGLIEKVFVTGCLSERYKTELGKEIEGVDAWFGTLELPALLNRLGADYKHELIGERTLTTPKHYAYLKISEGCNRTCAFCAIPLMRGKHISRTIEDLVQEAKHLAKNGIKEIMLIAQELTYYGLDIYKERKLPKLLKELAKVEGIEWIRLHYAYPNKFPMDVIDVIKSEPKVCNYLDIPLQHISDNVLKNMKRQITKKETQNLIDEIRNKIPGIAIRTTMLVGFPGETEKDFEELKLFVIKNRFERLGVFTYSHEEGTSAYNLKNDIPEKIKEDRKNELMEIQSEISAELNEAKIGSVFKVLIDRKEGEYFVGRTEFDSPEVDNEVLINAKENFVRIGDFVNVNVIDSSEFDIFGQVV